MTKVTNYKIIFFLLFDVIDLECMHSLAIELHLKKFLVLLFFSIQQGSTLKLFMRTLLIFYVFSETFIWSDIRYMPRFYYFMICDGRITIWVCLHNIDNNYCIKSLTCSKGLFFIAILCRSMWDSYRGLYILLRILLDWRLKQKIKIRISLSWFSCVLYECWD